MNKLSIFTIILFAFGLYMAPATFAGQDKQSGQSGYQTDQKKQTQAQQGQQPQQQGQNLLLVNKLSGTEIQNQQGQKIGEIDTVLVDVENGRIGFVTMTSGGVFGVGEEKYIVPFSALQKKMAQGNEGLAGAGQQGKLVFSLNNQQNQLKAVPEGDIEEAMTREGQSREIHEYYGVAPYWEDGQRQQQRQDNTQRQMMQDMKKDQKMDNKDQQKNQNK